MDNQIQPAQLHALRKRKGLTRADLAKLSTVSERTIQRLENESEQRQTTREHTLEQLAKALQVEEGVLTGAIPLPDADKKSGPDPERVQIGALIDSKVRNDYALIRRRYGVKASEIINAAPLLFVLLAEGSLAWRREKLNEANGAVGCLEQITRDIGYGVFEGGAIVAGNGCALEKESIDKADLFGEHLFNDTHEIIIDPFDSAEGNPFTNYLHKLSEELDSPGVVSVKRDDDFSFSNFPDHDICREDLDCITGKTEKAREALVSGHARLSEIPEELMEEGHDSRAKRIEWLESRLPDDWGDFSLLSVEDLNHDVDETFDAERAIDEM